MEKYTYTLLLGCGSTRATLTLKQHQEKRVDLWYENKLRSLGVEPENITGIIVGQGLVVELFSDAHFNHLEKTIENNTNPEGHKYEVGCLDDHPIWRGIIRSIKVWDYDKYHENGRLVKYCTSHDECDDNELCLCPGGENQKEWCLNRRKRCLNKAMFFHNAKKTVWHPDEIDNDCVRNLLLKMGVRYPLYGYVKNIAHLCKKMPKSCPVVEGFDNVGNIEGFNGENINLTTIGLFIMFILIIFVIFTKKLN